MEWYVPYDQFFARLHTFNCPCCRRVRKMPTEEDLEQMTTERIDRERLIALEIESIEKAVEKVENISGLSGV